MTVLCSHCPEAQLCKTTSQPFTTGPIVSAILATHLEMLMYRNEQPSDLVIMLSSVAVDSNLCAVSSLCGGRIVNIVI